MATFYVDDRASGANNGTSPTDAWQSFADYTPQPGGSVIEVAAGSGPYREIIDLKGNGLTGNYITWNFNGCRVTGAEDMNAAAYKWTASAGGVNEYYLELLAGGNPSLTETKCVTVDGWLYIPSAEANHMLGVVGSLSDKQPGWGDNDTLGFNTLYVRSNGGNPNTVSLDIEASQRDSILDTNWRYHSFNQFVFTHCETALVKCRQTVVAEPWLFDRGIFAYSDTTGIFSDNGSYKATSCLLYWCGHDSIAMGVDVVPVSAKVYNCTEWGAHLFARYATTCTAALILDVQNCLSGNNEAGAISKDSVAAVLLENNNMWYPRMTAGGGALGYVFPANWTPTDAADIPPSTVTTLSDQGLLQNPQFVRAVDDGYEKCDFRIKSASPAVVSGVDVGVTEYFDGTTIDSPPNIGAYQTAPHSAGGPTHSPAFIGMGIRI